MNQPNYFKSIVELNLAILFISTSGVLGRYIDMPIPITIGARALIAGVFLVLFCRLKGFDFRIDRLDVKTILISGVLLGVHWITYFYSLKMSNIAIAMLSLFTFPAMTSILEPIFRKTKILKFHLLLSLMVLVGIYFLAPSSGFQSDQFIAIGFGLISALCYALRNIIMKDKIEKYNGSILMTYQLIVIVVILTPFFFLMDNSNMVTYLPATVLLGLLTTAIGHTLFLYSLKNFSAVTASIMSCAQPVYGILLGVIFLVEYPTPMIVIGGSIIILSVVAESYRVYRFSN